MKKLSLLILAFISLTSFSNNYYVEANDTETIRFIKTIGGPKGRPILRSMSLTVDGLYNSENKTLEMIYYTKIGPATMYIDGFPYYLSGSSGTSETICLFEELESPTIIIICESGDEYQGSIN